NSSPGQFCAHMRQELSRGSAGALCLTFMKSAKVLCFPVRGAGLCRLRAAVAVVGGAGAFAGDHGGAERMLGGAARAESGAGGGFDQSLQHQSAQAIGRFVHSLILQLEPSLGVEVSVGFAKAEAAPWDFAHSSPLA